MSDEAGDTQYFSPDYKEGDLQIVEVTPFDTNDDEGNSDGAHILPEIVCEDQETRYMVETQNGPMELDLMNLTFVRCEDSEDTFQLQIAGVEADTDAEADADADAEAGSVACVLRARTDSDGPNQFTVVNGDKEQVVILTAGELVSAQPEAKEAAAQPAARGVAASVKTKPAVTVTPIDVLEKKLQKARAAMVRQHARSALNCGSRGGRKRRGAVWGGGGRGGGGLPPPHELLAAPNFRLYLYSCKLCDYRCNALKELREHKAAEHASGGGGGRARAGGAGRAGQPLQCARCPYRAAHHTQLMKHVKDTHALTAAVTVEMSETDEADEADGEGGEGGGSRVCSLCGHEAPSRRACREHMAAEHS